VTELVRAEVDERLEAAATYDSAGQSSRAARLRAEAAVIGAYLD
jgi:uncharacterized protein YqeY